MEMPECYYNHGLQWGGGKIWVCVIFKNEPASPTHNLSMEKLFAILTAALFRHETTDREMGGLILYPQPLTRKGMNQYRVQHIAPGFTRLWQSQISTVFAVDVFVRRLERLDMGPKYNIFAILNKI